MTDMTVIYRLAVQVPEMTRAIEFLHGTSR
jgi:hypothetical protein